MVEEEANPRMEGRRGEVRYTEKSEMQEPYCKMPSSQHPEQKCSPAPQGSSSSDVGADHVSINGSGSTFFTAEPTEIQERKPHRANLNVQSANSGRFRATKRAASRNLSALGQEKAAGSRNKEKGAARKNGTICPSALFRVVILTVLAGPSAAAILKQTRQSLPPDCKWLLKDHHDDCPDRADSIFAPLWNKLNTLCCDNYPGKFHCQFKTEGGTTFSVPACLHNQTVPIGKLGSLIINDSGYPELDLHSDCPSGTYRGHSIDSTFVRFEYCDSKTKGEPGEEKWCDGGPSADDTFICEDGFYAEDCPHGRNDHDFCPCQLVQFCNRPQLPFRNVTGKCENNSINVTYGCTFPASTSGMFTSTPSFQWSSSASGDRVTNSTTRSWIAKADGSSSNLIEGFIGPVLGAVVALVVMGGLVFFCWKRTRNSDRPEQEKMMTDSGSSSKDDSSYLDVSTEGE